MTVSKKTRFEVFKRDGFACQYCGRTPPTVILQTDHVIPKSQGGPDGIDNLLTSCEDCNSGKGAGALDQVPPTLQQKMQIQKERAEQLEAYNGFLLDARQRTEQVVDRLGCYWFNKIYPRRQDRYTFGDARSQSVRIFLQRLAEAEILEAVDIAHAKFPAPRGHDDRTWKYFCGVCWKKIRSQDE